MQDWEWYTAERRVFCLVLCMYILVCLRNGMRDASDGERAGKRGSQKSPKRCWWDLHHGCFRLLNIDRMNIAHLHFCCPFKIHTHTHSSFSRYYWHAKDRLHTQDTDIYVILKTLMRCFLSAKSQVFQRVGCQSGDNHFATMPLFSPKQLAWIREKEWWGIWCRGE